MKDNSNDFPEDILDIESKFLDNYDKMNKFIAFFQDVRNAIISNEKIKAIEINFSRILPETSIILPFSYIISINSKEYLLFLKNSSTPTFSKDELEEYMNLFLDNQSQVGIIIVWNDSKRSSIKLYRDEIFKPYKEIMNILKDGDRLLKLEELLEREVGLRERFSILIVPPPVEKIKAMRIPNLEREFNEDLNASYESNKFRRFQEPKRSIMRSIESEDFKPIQSLFSDFISEKVEMMEIEDIMKKLNITEEEE